MTKIEKQRCEKLIEKAKENLDLSDMYWKDYEKLKERENKTDTEIAMRQADQHIGYAEGIYQALVVIGYSSTSMEELTERI